jgi:hypothetical protein
VNTVVNFLVAKMQGIFGVALELIAFQEGPRSMELFHVVIFLCKFRVFYILHVYIPLRVD